MVHIGIVKYEKNDSIAQQLGPRKPSRQSIHDLQKRWEEK